MVAILRFVAPSGKSFITRAVSAHQGPLDVRGPIWARAFAKYGESGFQKTILWNKRNATERDITQAFNRLIREHEPEYN